MFLRSLKTIWQWLDFRLGLEANLWPMMRHPVPRGARWWYVFGSATMSFFILQVVTGICLALTYVPSAESAYASLKYLNDEQFLGSFLRALHYFGASGMVVLMAMHAARVFLTAAFKYPRQLTWLTGVGLLAATLGLAFSGQILRWDQDAYWGVGVAAAIAGRSPLAGAQVVRFLLGGPTIGAATLSRFFALHVFVLPGLLGGLLAIHLYLVLKLGISEPPVAGRPVDPKTYDDLYEKELHRGVPFFPNAFSRDAIFAAAMVAVVVAIAVVLGPKGPRGLPDPTIIHAEPRPDWYFLPLFALAALSPPNLETALLLGLPPLLLLALVLVPLVSGRGERSLRRRPVAGLTVLLGFVSFGVLVWLGNSAPWSPDMFAWSGAPVPENIVKGSTPLELCGAATFQCKDCRNCHSLEGVGGRRGPDLTDVGARLSKDELVRQVIQGGGNMPAYGDQLKPMEVEALVAFLAKLRPAEEAPPKPEDVN